MSSPASSSRLPARPSLEQLRKQAKDLLRQIHAGDRAAAQRFAAVGARLTEPGLADPQFVVARAYGFDNWAKLVHHVESLVATDRLQHFDQRARDYVDAWRGGEEGLKRLSDLHGRPLSPDEVRERVKRGFGGGDLTIDEARQHVARLYGFDNWQKLVESLAQPPSDPRTAPAGISSTPPFYRIDWEAGTIEPRGPLTDKDWDTLLAVMKEHRITGLDASGQMTDAVIQRLTKLDFVTRLNVGGSVRVTDGGMEHLKQMPQLQRLEVGGWHSPISDSGLEVLRHLPELRKFTSCWTRGISDAGTANLTFCDLLEEVDLLGSTTGDGTINALTGKRHLHKLKSGRHVTDAGLPLLQRFPVFTTPRASEDPYGLMEFLGGPTSLLLDGPITAKGLASLTSLSGVHGLSFFWHTTTLIGDSLAPLAEMPNLAMLGCQDALCDDAAMRHIAAIPRLRMLMAQGSVATDAGFATLSRSQTLEYIWGRKCPNLGNRGFVALGAMPSLKGLAVSCKNVHDDALSTLPQFPALNALMPMDVPDEGFCHVGRCERLEKLWCMYCRDTGDRATEHLAGLKRLQTYYAGATQITDRSLEILGRLESLEHVEFWEVAAITNDGIAALAQLPRLRELSIGGSPNVTRDVLGAFPPRVRVNYW
ncbi:MAG: hypothetical protein ACT4P6_18955 [Gemmatimonadaceae bacterium]